MNEPRLILEQSIRTIRSSSSRVGVIVAAMPGTGTVSDLREIAEESGIDFLHVRCSNMLPSDFTPLQVLDGPIARTIRPNAFDNALLGTPDDRETLIVADEPASAMGNVGAIVIRDAADFPGRPIVVSLATPDTRNRVLQLMSSTLDIPMQEIAVVMVPLVSSSEFAAFLRKEGPNPVADFVEANGLGAANPREWSNFSALVASDDWSGLDEAARDQLGRLTLGGEAYDAFVASKKTD